MRKLLGIAGLVIALCIAGIIVAWGAKAQIVSHYIGKQLGVSASIQQLDLSSTRAWIDRLWIGTPAGSRMQTSFAAQQMAVESKISQVLGDPLVIDTIALDNIFVGVELYSTDNKDNNWARMLGKPSKEQKGRKYLIRTLVLTNLTVQVMKPDGSLKQYPTIPRMEFHNISSDTGLPLSEIEREIFRLVLKDLFQKIDLNQILDTINAIKGGAPIRLPKLF
jgi:hypothetical protein